MNVQKLITESLRLIGATAAGEAPPMADLNDGMDSLNAMIGEWSADSLMLSAQSHATATLTGGVAAYSIGVGGTFNVPQPDQITSAVLTDTAGNAQYPVQIIGLEVWNTYLDKLVAYGPPSNLYYDRGTTQQTSPTSRGLGCTVNVTAPEGPITALTVNAGGAGYLANDILAVVGGNSDAYFKVVTAPGGIVATISIMKIGTAYVTGAATATVPSLITFPNGTINLYPFPDSLRSYSLTLNYDAQFTDFVNLSDEVSFPKSYHNAIKYNLAVHLAPEYGVEPSKTVAYNADVTLRKIMRRNIRMVPSDVGAGSGGRSNIYSGRE